MKTLKYLGASFLIMIAMALSTISPAQATTEPSPTPTTECGQVTESGVIVGDNSAFCPSPEFEYVEAVPSPNDSVNEVPAQTAPSVAEQPVPVVREELAYTGADDLIVLTAGIALITLGIVLVSGRTSRSLIR